jgi:hypothetical protein
VDGLTSDLVRDVDALLEQLGTLRKSL